MGRVGGARVIPQEGGTVTTRTIKLRGKKRFGKRTHHGGSGGEPWTDIPAGEGGSMGAILLETKGEHVLVKEGRGLLLGKKRSP